MKRFIGAIAAMSLSLGVADAYAQNFSTGAVNQYSTCGITPDLDHRLEDAKRFRDWYTQAGFPDGRPVALPRQMIAKTEAPTGGRPVPDDMKKPR